MLTDLETESNSSLDMVASLTDPTVPLPDTVVSLTVADENTQFECGDLLYDTLVARLGPCTLRYKRTKPDTDEFVARVEHGVEKHEAAHEDRWDEYTRSKTPRTMLEDGWTLGSCRAPNPEYIAWKRRAGKVPNFGWGAL